jgi:hypothetical protein
MKGVTTDIKMSKTHVEKSSARAQRRSHPAKLGIALTAFTIPTIGIKKSLSTILIAAGLVQERMKHTHVADVYTALQDVHREIWKLQQKGVEGKQE